VASADNSSTTIGSTDNALYTGVSKADSANTATPPIEQIGPSGHWENRPQCDRGGDQICAEVALCDDGTVMKHEDFVLPDGTIGATRTYCPTAGTDAEPHLTVADIRTAFEKIPMSASAVHIQPPDGETLVNFDTIFYSDPMTLDRSMTLVGQKVDFHITVASYTWHFGDGRTETTKDPGAAYPHQSITHRYLRKGTVNVSLDTTYQADYRVNGGPQQHLDDTVTIAGGGHPLTVRTATPHLVGE
jgi:hypothetical protein